MPLFRVHAYDDEHWAALVIQAKTADYAGSIAAQFVAMMQLGYCPANHEREFPEVVRVESASVDLTAGATAQQPAGLPRQLQLAGTELEQAAPGRGQGRMAPGQSIPLQPSGPRGPLQISQETCARIPREKRIFAEACPFRTALVAFIAGRGNRKRRRVPSWRQLAYCRIKSGAKWGMLVSCSRAGNGSPCSSADGFGCG